MAEDLFSELPTDPELAFVKLANHFGCELDRKIQGSEDRADTSIFMIHYMNQIIAAASELGIDVLSEFEVPSAQDNVYEIYREFSVRVQHILLRINIRHAKLSREFSVELDTVTKAKIHDYVNAIRQVIDRDEAIEERKKIALYAKLSAFADEVNKPRTRFDRAMAFIVEAMDPAFQMAQQVGELVDRITRLIAVAHGSEIERLPPPRERKKLEAPRKQAPARRQFAGVDDDISL